MTARGVVVIGHRLGAIGTRFDLTLAVLLDGAGVPDGQSENVTMSTQDNYLDRFGVTAFSSRQAIGP